MSMNTEAWLLRAQSFTGRVGILNASSKSGEALGFAISMATALYGSSSSQVEMLKRQADYLSKAKHQTELYEFVKGFIGNMVAEVNGGLIQNIRLGIVGEILADLMAMAREALDNGTVPVAAVLTAVAFEDLMRRLAREKAGYVAREKLEQVIIELKEKGILKGGEPAVAQSFLKFRNDSLHADWEKVMESQVTSCLGLLDALIVKHFG